MLISIIVALSKNLVIGKDNDLPWHLPEDLKYFKEITVGHSVIMGRKNYESIPEKYKPLVGRKNMVLTKNNKFNAPGCEIYNSMEEAISSCRKSNENEIFIIGGAEIYKYALQKDLVDKLYITWVDVLIEGDTFFPDIFSHWKKTKDIPFNKNEKNSYNLNFCEYLKKDIDR